MADMAQEGKCGVYCETISQVTSLSCFAPGQTLVQLGRSWPTPRPDQGQLRQLSTAA